MHAYTISHLAEDAGVSIHVIRDYELRGLLHPSERTEYGYRIYDERALERLKFVMAGKASGLSLSELSTLCKALDECDEGISSECINRIMQQVEYRHKALLDFKQRLARLQGVVRAV